MKKNLKLRMLFLCLLLWQTHQIYSQTPHASQGHSFYDAENIQWKEGPKSLPPGAMMAVIDGDPKVEGPFTMRLKFPAGYSIMPHTHPADEHITVIEGNIMMGMGQTFDEKKVKNIGKGGFVVMNNGTQHYLLTKKESIIQLHGIGPWGINYLNPKDDPRLAKSVSR
jgi:quercetin dioxygenase-like cupin family protein